MDRQCWLRARSGEPSAMNELVSLLQPRLSRMASYYARRCREDREDLLQEAWAGIFEALPALKLHIGDPEQYLLQYARWRLLDAVRRSLARQPVFLEDELQEAAQVYLPTHDEANVEIAQFLAQLKSTQRAVLMCLLAGLTWREAGLVLACSSANIAYHVRQIKQQYEAWRHGEGIAKNIPA
ncbi:MAG TPA: sigma-70 family RNA polymerase sigma factor [Armatimonadota bacterium]|nr:sigma-70 family RNA polymerase sigma factor [Armatimonadota bacterium]